MQELDWSEFDVDQTETAIQAAIFATEGLTFPFIDNGALDTRGAPLAKVEDYVAGIYVKTVFEKIFSSVHLLLNVFDVVIGETVIFSVSKISKLLNYSMGSLHVGEMPAVSLSRARSRRTPLWRSRHRRRNSDRRTWQSYLHPNPLRAFKQGI